MVSGGDFLGLSLSEYWFRARHTYSNNVPTYTDFSGDNPTSSA